MMAGKQTYFRCGACNTRNAYVRHGALPHDAEHYLPIHFIICRRCEASRTLLDGRDQWRGEAVEAAALTLKDRPDLSGNRAADIMDRILSDDPEARVEEAARQRRLKPFLRRYPKPRSRSLRLVVTRLKTAILHVIDGQGTET
jgi:hypothetical protein